MVTSSSSCFSQHRQWQWEQWNSFRHCDVILTSRVRFCSGSDTRFDVVLPHLLQTMSSSGIDYSKWDHFDDSSCSSSEEEHPYPRVTRLEAPSQVSTRDDGTISIQQTSSTHDSTGASIPISTKTKKKKSINDYIQEWTLHGGTCGDTSLLYWSQDRETVVLRMEIEKRRANSSIHVTLQGALPYRNRHCATTETCHLCITHENDVVMLEGDLPHPVYVQDDDDDVEWMVETVLQHKYLVITLYKATPMPNMTLWWKRPMTQFQEINGIVPTTSNSSKFQEAWTRAHDEFTNKMKAKQKQNSQGNLTNTNK